MSQPQPPSGGARRRSAPRRSRVNATTLLAVVLPVLSVLALLLVRPEQPTDDVRPPTSSTLTSATLLCPSALSGAPDVSLTTVAEGVDAQVKVGLGAKAADVPLRTGQVTSHEDDDALAVTGEDEAAPGLVASRSGGSEQAVESCRPPAADQWFTGLGAGANRSSVLELTNPDAGTAIADVTVQGRDGVDDSAAAQRLRGVSVPGGGSIRFNLAEVVPRTDDLALHVVATRGRIGASVLDRNDRVGSSPLTQDWLPAQDEPRTSNVLLGLAPGKGTRNLVIANPGDDEVRADLKVVGARSVFAPEGVDEIRVAPGSVVRVPVSAAVDAAVADDAVGVLLTSSGPVTATLRSNVDGDLSHAVAGVPFSGEAAVLLPEAPKSGAQKSERRVVLGAASSAGTATVTALAEDGSRLRRTEVELVPGRAACVSVPRESRQLRVKVERTSVTGAVVTSAKGGTSVVPLTVPVMNGQVPDVRPGLS